MECIITVKESDGKTSKHPVIDFNFIDAVENFCRDFGYKLTDIIAVVVIDQ
jgi:Ni2+-binding GTPase involved in maturation of urease and hydrogenase